MSSRAVLYAVLVSLPSTVRVRISPETAEGIGLSAVVSQQLPMQELLRNILGVTGKDPVRVAELLRRGSVVVGASRFRWEGFAADADQLTAALASFPNGEPDRPFNASNCVEAIFREGVAVIPLAREAGEKRRFLKRCGKAVACLAAVVAKLSGSKRPPKHQTRDAECPRHRKSARRRPPSI